MQSESRSSPSLLPWIEKYRPRRLNDVSHQDEIVGTLKRAIQSGNLPHLLFYGPPGTGKTSCILAAAHELYGSLMSKRVLELNASNERGIDVVRHRIKDFAQVAVSNETVNGYPCPPFKIIILDEADSMTRDAQSALRRTMEQYSKVTRFCIICNYVSRIIDPITSRCAKFRFRPLSSSSMISRLTHICSSERVHIERPTLDYLIQISEGDMRQCITLLQSAHRFSTQTIIQTKKDNHNKIQEAPSPSPSPSPSSSSSSSSSSSASDSGESVISISISDLVEVSGVIPSSVISSLLSACRSSSSFSAIQRACDNVIYEAYPVNMVLSALSQCIVNSSANDATTVLNMSDSKKAVVLMRCAEAEAKLIDGADERLQLMDVMSTIQSTLMA